MKVLALAALALAAAACGTAAPEEDAEPDVPPGSPVAPEVPGKWSFEGDAEGAPPAGFSFGLAGQGRPGSWVVRTESGAPSGAKVLAQVDADPTDARYPVALADGAGVKDLRLSVKFRTVSGEVDRAAGLVFRAKDERNYLLVRANALEHNVAFFRVREGIRETLGSADAPVPDGTWGELAVTAAGETVTVFLDGAKVLDGADKVFREEGRVGLWTKADSVTLFDDLVLEPR
jgi:hypothetical protein